MRLINTRTLLFKEFTGQITEPYAILSHRWGAEEVEVSYKDFRLGIKTHVAGHKKIRDFCKLAKRDGLHWVWVDTCCIDKRSSAELSEAINSMFHWYAEATACYVFMEDVASATDWSKSQWWSRGWTLQELIAPKTVIFCDKTWTRMYTKHEIAWEIEHIFHIPLAALVEQHAYSKYSAAQRMSWAANRQTTRIEDQAYCLLGLFQIHMPLLYGEGKQAFQRLQMEIVQKLPDESLLAWHEKTDLAETMPCGVFAGSPADFIDCSEVYRLPSNKLPVALRPQRSSPPRVTSWGIEIRARAVEVTPHNEHAGLFKYWNGRDPFWAITLTTLSEWGSIKGYACILILTRTTSSFQVYRRVECFHWNPDKDVKCQALLDRYKLGAVEEDKVLYLYHDEDTTWPQTDPKQVTFHQQRWLRLNRTGTGVGSLEPATEV